MKRPYPTVMLTVSAVLLGSLLHVTPASATFPGTNGKIAFSTDQSADPQIFTVSTDGTGAKRITDPSQGHAFAPDWSPGGRQIVFQGDATGHNEIYIMNADGTGRRQLTTDPFDHLNPRFSPDGSKIAYAGCGGPTCVIDVMGVNGTGAQRLTSVNWNAFDPEWSPDGTKIAFDSDKNGFVSAVWVMRADGSDQRRLTPAYLEGFYPDWSPDGAQIIFSTNNQIPHSNVYVINANGSGLKQLTHVPRDHNAAFASFSPDGKRIVLMEDLHYSGCPCFDMYTMNPDGTGLTLVVSDRPGAVLSDWGPKPSP